MMMVRLVFGLIWLLSKDALVSNKVNMIILSLSKPKSMDVMMINLSVKGHFVNAHVWMSKFLIIVLSSMCLWNGDKNIAGCPCKVKKVWGEPDREMTKEEIK